MIHVHKLSDISMEGDLCVLKSCLKEAEYYIEGLSVGICKDHWYELIIAVKLEAGLR